MLPFLVSGPKTASPLTTRPSRLRHLVSPNPMALRVGALLPVAAPISGYVTKIGYADAGDRNLKFVEITNPALRVAARVFYVKPRVRVGQAVAMGRPIGTARSLQRKYPGGMTDHVHLEIIDRRGVRLNAEKIITAQYVPVDVETDLQVAVAD